MWHQGLNVGRDFHVLPSRLRATWAVAVCAAVRREVAVSAIGVANVVPFERHLRTNYDRTDPLSDHVEELTDLFTDWVTTTWRTCTRRPKRLLPTQVRRRPR